MKSLLRLMMVSLLVMQVAFAQKTITGVVSDDQGMPLPGATVLEQGTSNGVTAGMYHRCVDLNITAVNSELYTYLNANAPNYGLNQERPEYNNITNGIGHFSSRSILNMKNLRIDQSTMDSISFGQLTKNLNFACYSTLGTEGLIIKFGFDCEEN